MLSDRRIARPIDHAIPDGARPAARVLILGADGRLLLLEAEHASDGSRFWLAPGGGLEPGERFEDAAKREVLEETGLQIEVDRCVWTRHHVYDWGGRMHSQYERYFTATTSVSAVKPIRADDYVIGHRWWNLEVLLGSDETFVPHRLPALWSDIMRGETPRPPFDCGV